ncbi:MAG TPA: cobalt-precorrin-5B (C(1))-methyltransferase [Candidatus Angelobacter sp.]|nr:cobalt-precorrin-5B (C(1))-methyltransferase [Candidatus Angelobacter sp.]
MNSSVPPRKRGGLRSGYTTGACAAAAAKAAARCSVQGISLREIETTLPNGQRVTFALNHCEPAGPRTVCSVIKDAGDDPDCTHGAELVAEVVVRTEAGIEVEGGAGVARVTKPGLGLEIGGPAINPVPRQNITAMVAEELQGSEFKGARVIISVPGGEKMAEQTINARLGLLGGISILGTTGIVRPYSTAAFKASVIQAIDVACAQGASELVLTTGGRSELYAMKLFPELGEQSFIQMGDFVGIALKHCARKAVKSVNLVGMIGKLSKMADGKMQTHAAGSEVNMELLAELASELGASQEIVSRIREANTARHVLELCQAHGLGAITSQVCRRAMEQCERHVEGKLSIRAVLVDFDGKLLGQFPAVVSESRSTQ